MSRGPRMRVAHAFRRTALPLASYYAVTLAVPLANGAALSGAFVEHALAVLVVPPVAVIVACAVHALFISPDQPDDDRLKYGASVTTRPCSRAAPLDRHIGRSA